MPTDRDREFHEVTQRINLGVLTQGSFRPTGDIWQHPVTFMLLTLGWEGDEELLLAPHGAGMLLNIP